MSYCIFFLNNARFASSYSINLCSKTYTFNENFLNGAIGDSFNGAKIPLLFLMLKFPVLGSDWKASYLENSSNS